MPFAGGIVCGDAHFFRQRAELSLNIPAETSCPVSNLFPVWICLAGFLLLFLTYFLSDKYRIHWLYGVSVFLCCFGLGAGMTEEYLHRTDFPFSDEAAVYQAIISEQPEMKERSLLCRVRLEGRMEKGAVRRSDHEHTFLFYFPKDSTAASLSRGDRLWVRTPLTPPVNNGNPDEFDYIRYLVRKDGTGTAYIPAGHWRIVGHDSSRTLRQIASDYQEKVVGLYHHLGFQGDNLAVLSALTVGDKENLSEDIRETYSITGASHVLALSGLHIGFLYALLFFLLSLIWKRWSYFKPFGLFLIILFLWGFAFLTGLSSSVVRSVIMFSLLAISGLQPEKPLTLNTLAATAFLMLLYNPLWLFDVGFQLSFVAVASILLIQPKLYNLLSVQRRIPRYIWGLLTVSVAAQIGTAPLVILYFSRFSSHFLLTNLWVIPMVTLILYSAVFMLILTPFPVLQQGFASVVNILLSSQNHVLRRIEQFPMSSIDGLWLEQWEIVLFYLFIMLLFRSLAVRTSRSIYLSLCCLLLFTVCHAVSLSLSTPRRSIAFYNVRGCPAVHCLAANGESWLACADSLPDVSRLYRALSPNWNHQRLSAPKILTGDYVTSGFAFHNHIVSYAGKRICLLHDARWRNKISSHPLSIDYLYISKGYKGRIEELTTLFRIRTVILDTSLSDYRSDILKEDCSRLTIPCISLKERGALCIRL
ncbi:ComEC/Rec2 family competence protein [Bacteroides timonensis]|uniref:ComEC/Rec2 family competence protein n=1 Tax=Bacteroides timonensis TaxID=1470345 RepID=UPI0004B849AB|nr:ComEC/Rec2 family competence protein [Bacteroides timonensis]